MTTESSGKALRRSRGHASVPDRLRERLVDGMGLWKAQLAYDTAILEVLNANPGEDPTSVERATTALHMYSAIEAIEEFESALVRLENGRYGTCESCGEPIPMERLEVLPQTRFCAACPATADKSPRSRPRRGRREHSHGYSPPDYGLAAAPATVHPRLIAESRACHPSSLLHDTLHVPDHVPDSW